MTRENMLVSNITFNNITYICNVYLWLYYHVYRHVFLYWSHGHSTDPFSHTPPLSPEKGWAISILSILIFLLLPYTFYSLRKITGCPDGFLTFCIFIYFTGTTELLKCFVLYISHCCTCNCTWDVNKVLFCSVQLND